MDKALARDEDGILSAEEFQVESMAFLTLWNNASKGLSHWRWQKCPYSSAGGYLILEDMPKVLANDVAGENFTPPEAEVSLGEDDCSSDSVDVASLVRDPSSVQQHFSFTYHAIYSESYQVPMLYFQGCLSDGRTLGWEDMERTLPDQSRHLVEKSRWTFLTQQEHPFLNRPWFCLHPCGTSSIMGIVLSCQLNELEEADSFSAELRFCQSVNSHVASVVSEVDDAGNSSATATSTSNRFSLNRGRFIQNTPQQYISTWLSLVGPFASLHVPLDLFKTLSSIGTNQGN